MFRQWSCNTDTWQTCKHVLVMLPKSHNMHTLNHILVSQYAMGLEGVYKGLHVLVDSTCSIVPLTVLLRGWCSRWYSWGSHASSPGQRPRWPSAKHSKIWISHYNGNWALFGFRFSIEIHGNGLTCLVQYKPYILTYIHTVCTVCMYNVYSSMYVHTYILYAVARRRREQETLQVETPTNVVAATPGPFHLNVPT